MVTPNIRVDTSKLDARIQNLRGVTAALPFKVIERLALATEGEMKREAPVSPGGGRLRTSIEAKVFGDHAIVGTSVEYAKWVVQRTKPHRITPREKLALAWPGGPGPRRSVQHPGTKANPFHLRALATIKDHADRIAEQVISEETARV